MGLIHKGVLWMLRISSAFAIDFACGNGDIAFHFNPRFDEGAVVVCNTMQHQNWGSEERTYHMPFQRGMYFEIIVNVKNNCYQGGSCVIRLKPDT